MSAENRNSTTVEKALRPSGNGHGEKRLEAGTESEFLAQEAEKAKAAITATVQRLGDDLRQATDIHQWTRQHPWGAVGAAAAAGFVAAAAFLPHGPPEVKKPRSRKASRRRAAAAPSVLGSLTAMLTELASTSAVQFLQAAFSAGSPMASQPPAPHAEMSSDPVPTGV